MCWIEVLYSKPDYPWFVAIMFVHDGLQHLASLLSLIPSTSAKSAFVSFCLFQYLYHSCLSPTVLFAPLDVWHAIQVPHAYCLGPLIQISKWKVASPFLLIPLLFVPFLPLLPSFCILSPRIMTWVPFVCLLSPPAPSVQVFRFQRLSTDYSSIKSGVQLPSPRFAMSTCSTATSLDQSPSTSTGSRNQRVRAV